jgi:hypothetical protein
VNVRVGDHLDRVDRTDADRTDRGAAEMGRLDAGRPGGDRADLARSVANAVEAVPGVVRLVGGGGPLEVATLYRHGKVIGVRLTDRTVIVHVAVGVLPLQEVTTAVGRAVRDVLSRADDDRGVAVVVEELEGVSAFPESVRRRPAGGRTTRSGR